MKPIIGYFSPRTPESAAALPEARDVAVCLPSPPYSRRSRELLAAPRGRLIFSDTEMLRPENPGQGISKQHTDVSSFL